MGLTLLLLCHTWKNRLVGYRVSLRLLAMAMLVMAAINYAELWSTPEDTDPTRSLSIVVMAASIELLLLWYAYIAILDKYFITRLRTVCELTLLVAFTLPPLLIDPDKFPIWHGVLFYISIVYYTVKFGFNLWVYMNLYLKVQGELRNFYSGTAGADLLNWINNSFVLIISIGLVSIIVPLTNYVVMTLYQVFLFFAYFYFYVTVIRHLDVFITNLERISQAPAQEVLEDTKPEEAEVRLPDGVLVALQEWIEKRQYAKPGITIEDMAIHLGTNRTLLSRYLNTNLNQSFYEWIARFRIEDAKRLLIENPTLPIIEIGTYVGIEDRSNFDKLFKRFVGTSPANFRIEYGKDQINSIA